MLQTTLIPVLNDNYIFLLHEPKATVTAVVDPAKAEPVLQYISKANVSLDYILNTHHHWDHVGGNVTLKKKTECHIIGHKNDAERIPGIDTIYKDGDTFLLGEETAHVMDIPGHTIGHIAYYFPASKSLFCGDTLFAMGCGRLFEGTAEQMFHSLAKLKNLPDDTLVYCAHEYTKSNAEFALTIEPNNIELQKRYNNICDLRQKEIPTIPSTIGIELSTNPFLRTNSLEIRQNLNLLKASDIKVFAEIRKRKDGLANNP